MFDLVGDEEFCNLDGRIPLLLVTQFGVYPPKDHYGNKQKVNYQDLEIFINQNVGFLGRGYPSRNEREGVKEFFININTLHNIRNERLIIGLGLWSKLI